MTQEERRIRLQELRDELQSPNRFRDRKSIIMEGRALRHAFDMYKAKNPETKLI